MCLVHRQVNELVVLDDTQVHGRAGFPLRF